MVAHFVVEDLGFARFGLGNQELVENVEDIAAHLVQLGLDLLAVFADLANVLLVVFGFLLLFDAGDDAPRRTSCTDNILVGNRQQIAFIDGEFSAKL